MFILNNTGIIRNYLEKVHSLYPRATSMTQIGNRCATVVAKWSRSPMRTFHKVTFKPPKAQRSPTDLLVLFYACADSSKWGLFGRYTRSAFRRTPSGRLTRRQFYCC